MAQFLAVVTEDVPANRLLSIVGNEGEIHIGLTPEGEQPEFHSTNQLEKESKVTVTIKNESVWDIEAGESLLVGTNVEAGEGGVLVATEDTGIGYIVSPAEQGEIATFIRRSSGGSGERGPAGPKGDKGDAGDQGQRGTKGDKGDPGEVTQAQLDEAIDGLRTELSGE